MATEADGFFSRWSRRKAQAQVRTAVVPEPGTAATAADPTSVPKADVGLPGQVVKPPLTAKAAGAAVHGAGTLAQGSARGEGGAVAGGAAQAGSTPAGTAQSTNPPPPTLDDVAQLTPESDFKPFVGRAVPTEVKNAAMKKLFADPHFNVMDGLDIYIDDYSKPNPLPAEWLKKMVSAQVMKLVEEEAPAAPPATAATAAVSDPAPPTPAPGSSAAALPQPALSETPPLSHPAAHDHPDLQLQPDHATRRGGTEPGAG